MPTIRARGPLLVICGLAFLAAFAVRLHFVTQVLTQWRELPEARIESDRVGPMMPDSRGYLTPARAVLAGDLLHAGSLLRPPGYPLFLALMGANLNWILPVQALLGALMAPLCALLVHVLTRRLSLAALAGLPVAISPTGIGLSGLVVADLFLAALFLAGFLLLTLGARRSRSSLLASAGAAFGFASLVKPILVLWAPISLLVWWLLAPRRRRDLNVTVMVIFVGLQIVPLLGWSARNLLVEGVFTPSSAGALAARLYLGARTEAWVRHGGSPPARETRAVQSLLRERDRSADFGAKQKLQQHRGEIRALVREHPGTLLAVYLTNARESLEGGWDYFALQLPLSEAGGGPYSRTSHIEGRLRPFAPWVVIISLLAQITLLAIHGRARVGQSLRDTVALATTWGYFVALGAITFWTGPRLLYPVQFTVVALVMFLLHSALETTVARRPALEPNDQQGRSPLRARLR